MRIRSIKPEFWRSEDITRLDWETRLIFIGLWSYVDDNGVGKDHAPSIVADLFAEDMFSDPRETVARVSRGLQNLSEAGRIARYATEDGQFLYIVNWSKHQRIDKPNKARYPLPSPELQASGGDSRECRESVARPQEIPAPGAGEQGNRGTEEQGNSSLSSTADADAPDDGPATELTLIHPEETGPSTDELFDRFWAEYPRKDGKKKAREKFTQALKRANPDTIIDAAHAYAVDPNREQAYTKQATTWLNGDHWEDPALPPRQQRTGNAQDRRSQQIVDLVARNMGTPPDERRQIGA